MSTEPPTSPPTNMEPWQWPEETWRKIVGRARAGRSLRPASWPQGARCAVAISFDADHETIPLRDNDESPMRISQGQYGNRQAMPRILKLLARESVPTSFFYPAVAALLHPEEVRAVDAAGKSVREGQPLSASLKQSKLFPGLALDMIEVGESTGALPTMLNSVAEFFEEDVNTKMTAALSLIEPAIMIVMGAFVAFVLIALYLPIFSLADTIH